MPTSDLRLAISDLARQALATMSPPWPQDVTDRVCLAIEANPRWLKRYEQLLSDKGKRVVNPLIGKLTRELTGLRNLGGTRTARSSLIKTYTPLG